MDVSEKDAPVPAAGEAVGWDKGAGHRLHNQKWVQILTPHFMAGDLGYIISLLQEPRSSGKWG